MQYRCFVGRRDTRIITKEMGAKSVVGVGLLIHPNIYFRAFFFTLDKYDCQDYNVNTYLGTFFNHSVAIPLYEF